MTGGSLVYAAFCGRGPEMLAAALGATADAITLTLTLGAGYLLFCGWMKILQALGAPRCVCSCPACGEKRRARPYA